MIDRQIIHYKDDNLRKLGDFISRKRKLCIQYAHAALTIREEHVVDDNVLRELWAAQIENQTAPLKRKFCFACHHL